jgi:hypothetical protein
VRRVHVEAVTDVSCCWCKVANEGRELETDCFHLAKHGERVRDAIAINLAWR